MTLLDNELVRKYFYDEKYSNPTAIEAVKVITAMQQPIRKGERYLVTYQSENVWEEMTIMGCEELTHFHPMMLRLPDEFQKKECLNVILTCSCGKIVPHDSERETKPTPSPEKCECQYLGKNHVIDCGKYTDAVEEKIMRILELPWADRLAVLKYSLYDLVRLAHSEHGPCYVIEPASDTTPFDAVEEKIKEIMKEVTRQTNYEVYCLKDKLCDLVALVRAEKK